MSSVIASTTRASVRRAARATVRRAPRAARRAMSTAPGKAGEVRQFTLWEIYGDKGALPVAGALAIALGLAAYFGSSHLFGKSRQHPDVYMKNRPNDTEFGVREVRSFSK